MCRSRVVAQITSVPGSSTTRCRTAIARRWPGQGLGHHAGGEGSAQLLSEAVEHGSQRVGNRALAQADGPPLVAEDQREVVLEAVGARRWLGFVIRRFERARKCLGLVGVEIELRGPP